MGASAAAGWKTITTIKPAAAGTGKAVTINTDPIGYGVDVNAP
jgi:hypothetical protein